MLLIRRCLLCQSAALRMRKAGLTWLPPHHAAEIKASDSDAFRLAFSGDAAVDRYGDVAQVSARDSGDLREIIRELVDRWGDYSDNPLLGIYGRELVHNPTLENRPYVLWGKPSSDSIATELGFRYRLDFSAGYSCGLFLDQRANRHFLADFKPQKVLNCFAFTCAFSVVAAASGADTLSLDLSKPALERGRDNFELNQIERGRHRFLRDDVFDVLPRLARRGETFDAIILDPPTFSRSRGRRVWQVEKDLGSLLTLGKSCLAPGGVILLSTNCSRLSSASLRRLALQTSGFHTLASEVQPDFPEGQGARTLWLRDAGA